MRTLLRLGTIAIVGVTALSAGCQDGLLHEAAPPAPASISISASLLSSAGGDAEAFNRVDNVTVRFSAGDEVRLEQQRSLDPSAPETRLAIQLPLRAAQETFTLELELRAGAQALFRGSSPVELSAGGTAQVEVGLLPVIASVTCSGPQVEMAAYGTTVQLAGAALFATGDTVRNATLQWSTADGTIVSVEAATGVVTALADGTAQVQCRAGTATDSRAVRVFAVVTSVAVAPPTASIVVGATHAFTATLRDARSNVITGRTVTWSSNTPAVATVNNAGVATGQAPGTSRIDASSGGVTGSATLTVIVPLATVVTGNATNVGATSAVLNGTVNPNGFVTQAWFEWGTSATLATSSSTPTQSVGSGSAAVPTSAQIGSLLPNTTYYFRQAASTSGGTARGQIQSFTTSAPPIVRTVSATVTSATQATLQGAANPQGAATQVWFEWGTSQTLTSAQSTAPQNIGAGRSEAAFSAVLSNLTPGVTYFYRAVASSTGGTERGQILSFSTQPPPTVTTSGAAVSGLSATLEGEVNPNGAATEAWFDWGTSPNLTTFDRTPLQSLGAGTVNRSFSQAISGLQPGTTYYVRASAANAAGTAVGDIESFQTPAPGPPTFRVISAFFIPNSDAELRLVGGATPNGSTTVAWFQWSYFPDFRNAELVAAQSVGGGYIEVQFNNNNNRVFTSCGNIYVRVGGYNASGQGQSATAIVPDYCGGFGQAVTKTSGESGGERAP